METFTDDFARIGNQDKCTWLYLPDVLPELYSLVSLEYGKYNVLFIVGKGAFCFANSGTATQFMHDKIADWLRGTTYNIEVFTKVDAFDDGVDHQRFGK